MYGIKNGGFITPQTEIENPKPYIWNRYYESTRTEDPEAWELCLKYQEATKPIPHYGSFDDVKDGERVEYKIANKDKNDCCPECGSKNIVNKNLVGNGCRDCKDCGQEWWIDVKYDSKFCIAALPVKGKEESKGYSVFEPTYTQEELIQAAVDAWDKAIDNVGNMMIDKAKQQYFKEKYGVDL